MSKALAMILAGGQGKRLAPLTLDRAKPAVPFGGTYRIIDFVLSNFVNSGFMQIKVLTQFMSNSLNQHISRNWTLSPTFNQYVDSVPAQMRTGDNWYLGSADAIFQNLNLIKDESPRHVFVFSGDHIYKMDVSQMYNYHNIKNADMTIAAIPVPIEEATEFGVIEIDKDYRMIGFEEKPKNPKSIPGRPDTALVSMGNYLFSTDILVNAVTDDAKDESSVHDFGKNVIPALFPYKRVFVYDFLKNSIYMPTENDYEKPYWRDVGTIKAYFDSHMDLVSVSPAINLYNRNWPIFGFPEVNMPPAKFVFADEKNKRLGVATDSIISEGCIVSGGSVNRSVLSPGVRVNSYTSLKNCIILNDVNIGRYCELKNVIVDKHVTIPSDTKIGFDLKKDAQRGLTVTEEGIVVIPKGYNFQEDR
ncbi:MAG TPA: glucose-1-phosphate adenylyltransferase [bacterium]|jgi:glucose-1-phosphate adenylyltransferase|nr:glucose-1-phosphate adenylyltransferase [bacterium]